MKRLVTCLLAAVALSWGGEALASGPCTPGPNWTQTWTDAFSQTSYTISAPPCVFVNVPFNIVVTVTDSTWPNDTVGSSWAVLDNGVAVPGGSGTVITTVAGTWQATIPVTYTVLIVNHSIQFQFMDFGSTANSGHFWPLVQTPIGGTTLDPYPPGTEPPVTDPPVTDPPPADPATGCSSGGGQAGLLAFLAMAVGFRRRRRA